LALNASSNLARPGVVGVLRPSRWLVEVLVAALMAALVINAVSGWRAANTANAFPESLGLAARPRPADSYLTMTAAQLNGQQPERRYVRLRVRYISAGQVSSGPFVVSVHPIDASTWAAVARGSDGRCYGTLVSDPVAGDFQVYYAEFPAGAPCEGRLATTGTVTSTHYPAP
jgi:hypothetical protein